MGRGRLNSETTINRSDGAPRGRETMTVVNEKMAAAARDTEGLTKTEIPREPKRMTKTGRAIRRITVWGKTEKVTARMVPARERNQLAGTRNTRQGARVCSTDLTTMPLCHVEAGRNLIDRHEKKQEEKW